VLITAEVGVEMFLVSQVLLVLPVNEDNRQVQQAPQTPQLHKDYHVGIETLSSLFKNPFPQE
jgi:hypothetical protein